jgi:hypothetical protein
MTTPEKDPKFDGLVSDIAHKHTPDSCREECYRELQEKYGLSKKEAQKIADERHGDYWG